MVGRVLGRSSCVGAMRRLKVTYDSMYIFYVGMIIVIVTGIVYGVWHCDGMDIP
jgi:hypothetical protein